jgi:hypothetical protein
VFREIRRKSPKPAPWADFFNSLLGLRPNERQPSLTCHHRRVAHNLSSGKRWRRFRFLPRTRQTFPLRSLEPIIDQCKFGSYRRSIRLRCKSKPQQFYGFHEPGEVPSGLDHGLILDSLSRVASLPAACIESTVRYLGIEVDDALAIGEQVDV